MIDNDIAEPRAGQQGKQQLRRHAGTLGWLAGSSYANYVIQFGASIVLARLVAPGEYGTFAFGLLAYSTTVRIIEAGFDEALLNARGEPAWRGAHRYWNVRAGLLVAGLTAAIGGVIAVVSSPTIGLCAATLGGAAAWGTRWRTHQVLLRQAQRWRAIAITSVPATVAGASLSIALALNGVGAFALCAGMALSLILGPFLARLLSGAVVPRNVDADVRRAMWDYGPAPRWGRASLAAGAVLQIDNLCVGLARGPFALGLYSRAYGLGSLPATQLTHLLTIYAQPQYARLMQTPAGLQSLYTKLLGLVTYVALLAGLLFAGLGSTIVTFLYGEQWAGAGAILQALSLYIAFKPLQDDAASLLQVTGHPKLSLRIAVAQAFVLALAAWPVAEQFGPVGVALCLGMVQAAGAVALQREVVRIFKVQTTRFLAMRYGLAGAIGGAALVAAHSTDSVPGAVAVLVPLTLWAVPVGLRTLDVLRKGPDLST